MIAMLQPPVDRDADFNEWYDGEHAFMRNTVPGFMTARRWQQVTGWNGTGTIDPQLAAEEESVPRRYLAYYDLDDLAVLDGDDYQGLKAVASDNEWAMLDALTSNDRRVYRPLELPEVSNSTNLEVCGPLVMCTWWEVPDESQRPQLEEWYHGEHIPMLMAVPGWKRIRLFERTEPGPGHFFAMHDIESLAAFDTAEHLAAADTPWRTEAIAGRTGFTRRLYRLWKRFDAPID
jgi:hypothetical protein